jgi:hypothetical protein
MPPRINENRTTRTLILDLTPFEALQKALGISRSAHHCYRFHRRFPLLIGLFGQEGHRSKLSAQFPLIGIKNANKSSTSAGEI